MTTTEDSTTATPLGPVQCGRPTRAKTPCKATRPGNLYWPACRQHCTAEEKAMAEAQTAAYWQGWREGEQRGAGRADYSVEQLQKRMAKMEAERDAANLRMRTHDGAQIVQIEGYSYRWDGTPDIAVGDEVMVPGNYVSAARGIHGPYPGTVTALGTTYTGPLARIIRIIRKVTR